MGRIILKVCRVMDVERIAMNLEIGALLTLILRHNFW